MIAPILVDKKDGDELWLAGCHLPSTQAVEANLISQLIDEAEIESIAADLRQSFTPSLLIFPLVVSHKVWH
jgi:hypothetical protein